MTLVCWSVGVFSGIDGAFPVISEHVVEIGGSQGTICCC